MSRGREGVRASAAVLVHGHTETPGSRSIHTFATALKARAVGLEDKVSGVTVQGQISILGVSLDQDLHLSGRFLHT